MSGAVFDTALCFVCWSILVALVYILLPTWFLTRANGMRWNAGPRDETPNQASPMGQRLERARKNFFETYPLFLAAMLVAVGRQHPSSWIAWGAETYVWARLIYIPLYAFGVSYVRSLAWFASLIGIGLILFGAVHT
jgi:uncharacterized MAPEG superfamily protein